MTLIALWVRKSRTIRELVVAADSRVTGGERWDSCPKVVVLPRPATVMAMSGDTNEAPPFLIHAISTCHLLDGHEVGRTDIRHLANQLQRVFEDNRKHVSKLPVGQTNARILASVHLALAGWSWRRQRFEAYTYWFEKDGSLQHDYRQLEGRTKSAHFIGDGAGFAKVRLAQKNRAERALAQRKAGPGVPLAPVATYEWQPLDVLLDVIEDSATDSVGGAPQVTRIYQNGLTEQFIWRDESGSEHFGGRPILDDERSDRRVMQATARDPLTVSISFSQRSYKHSNSAVDDTAP